MRSRTSTLVTAGLLAVGLVVLAATLPVPLVALGPGPTYDTLSVVDGTPVVRVDGLPTYPTSGHLNMTTVSVVDRITLFNALGFWASSREQVVPRSVIYPLGKTDDQVEQQNDADFSASESDAELAAIASLHLPTRVTVGSLVANSPAEGKLKAGDTIVAVSGKTVDSPQSLTDALAGTRAGQAVTVTYRRGSTQAQTSLVLGVNPAREQGFLGVTATLAPAGGDITIKLGDIGGPSAGLMFALAVVDKLTPVDLTGGRFVAGTGEIDAVGTVGPIGGIPFKMRAARDAGATTFLVPAANCDEARANDPDGLALVKVGTLADAVAALGALRAGRPVAGC